MDISKVIDIKESILVDGGYVPLNKKLIKEIGLLESILYSEMVSLCIMYAQNKKLNEFGEFYWTIPQVEDKLNISKRQQATLFAHLEELGLIVVNNRVPHKKQRAVRHIRIVEDSIYIKSIIDYKRANKEKEEEEARRRAEETKLSQGETPLERVVTF